MDPQQRGQLARRSGGARHHRVNVGAVRRLELDPFGGAELNARRAIRRSDAMSGRSVPFSSAWISGISVDVDARTATFPAGPNAYDEITRGPVVNFSTGPPVARIRPTYCVRSSVTRNVSDVPSGGPTRRRHRTVERLGQDARLAAGDRDDRDAVLVVDRHRRSTRRARRRWTCRPGSRPACCRCCCRRPRRSLGGASRHPCARRSGRCRS